MTADTYAAWYPEMYAWMVADAQRSIAVAKFILGMHAEGAHGKASVLDAGCGPGQIAAALAHGGARVTAVDSSRVMIEQAKAATAGLGVTLVEEDFSSILLQKYGPFDIVACLFNTFGHASVCEPSEILRLWTQWLRPDGVIYIEFPRLESSAPGFSEHESILASGVVVNEQRDIDHHKQKCNLNLEFSDKRESVTIEMDLYTFDDIKALARSASLEPRFWDVSQIPFSGVRGSHCVSLSKVGSE